MFVHLIKIMSFEKDIEIFSAQFFSLKWILYERAKTNKILCEWNEGKKRLAKRQKRKKQ